MGSNWRSDLLRVLDQWANQSSGVVLSADVDGLVSCALLAQRYPVQVIGVYTTTHLVLLDGASESDAADALWLDHDVSQPGIKCVGQHLVHHKPTDHLPLREPDSFNPNVWQRQSWADSFSGRSGRRRDKYPYGTCHFLAHAFGVDPGSDDSELAALLAHADGTWRTVVDYQANADIWYELMFRGNNFLQHLRDNWAASPAHLQTHSEVVAILNSLGVSKTPSRAKIAALLPEQLRALTGRQSVLFNIRDFQPSVDKVDLVLKYISSQVGSSPTMSQKHTKTVTGVVETPYPNTIKDFDQFMLENQIFSHAFTDLRTLRFTKGINLKN